VGADEAFGVAFDGGQVMHSVIGKISRAMERDGDVPRRDVRLAVPRGIGLTAIPRPERFYFAFGKPIGTKRSAGKHDDHAVLRRIRRQTSTAFEKLLVETLSYRAPSRGPVSVWREILKRT
jgi:hypothetical protein